MSLSSSNNFEFISKFDSTPSFSQRKRNKDAETIDSDRSSWFAATRQGGLVGGLYNKELI